MATWNIYALVSPLVKWDKVISSPSTLHGYLRMEEKVSNISGENSSPSKGWINSN